MNKIITKSFKQQNTAWPQTGKHILAQYDDDTVIVYQAYRKSIGNFASSNQYFGGDFSYTRMSWIKPNFLWMMYRSGWGTKQGQEVILAVRINRAFFDRILEHCVISSFIASNFESEESWKQALQNSNVRLQWDPDHCPAGKKRERKALQLGLRNEFLKEYGRDAIVEITDISEFVSEQREFANDVTGNYEGLIMPEEKVYIPASDKAVQNIGLDG